MKNKNTMAKRCVSFALATVMALSLAGCKAGGNDGSQPGSGTAGQSQTGQAPGGAAGEKIVNIGVTNTLNTLNPLLMDGMEMNKYATGLMFLPLMELDKDMNFEGMLADSVTAEDDRNFLVHIDDKAVWSDGQPVTADDVVYTALRICSPAIGNMAMMYYVFEGVGDDGFVEEGADHVEGITKVDDKTVRFTTKAPMSLITFNSSYARYLMTLPKHVIENMSEQELMSDPWFNRPDVVSGPYKVTEFDRDHYVSYEANDNYWKGAPKIDRLNIKIVEGSQLYAGLKSGEIDIGIGRMSDPELMSGLHYELLFLESLKLVVRPGHPLLQETVTLSRVMEWPVVVSPKGTVPRQNAEALLQSQGCKMPAGCIETLSASLSRQLTVDFDYVWFVPSGAVKDDLRRGVLTALPIATQGAGEPIGILTRVDATLTPGTQTLLSAIRKSMPA